MLIQAAPVDLVCYVFVHSALSGIQKGIQGAHAVAGLIHSCRTEPDSHPVNRWAGFDRTIIMLEGGFTQKLKAAAYLVRQRHRYFEFYEDEATLEGAMTAVAFVCQKPSSLSTDPLDEHITKSRLAS